MTTLFAHRGFADLSKNISENTIESLNEAVKRGFNAIEFDIWLSGSELVINHDDPEEKTIHLPKLKDYFKFGNKLKYWMDFKNMDENNIDEILLLLEKEIITQKINLDQIYFAPFIQSYNIATIVLQKLRYLFGNKTNFVALCQNNEDIGKLIKFISQNDVKFVSIKHDLINKELVNKLNNITIFAWTVNDLSIIKNLASIGIKNFATDIIIP